MDFQLDPDLAALQALAAEILEDKATDDRVHEVEQSDGRFDEALWTEFARAGLLGVALPEEYGGAGLGLAALCVVLEEQGRKVAPIPLWPAGVAAMAVAAHGSDKQRAGLLPGAASGELRIALALEEFDGARPERPACTAAAEGDGVRLTGVKAAVPTPSTAAHVLVSATGEHGPGLYLLDAAAPGVSWQWGETTSRDRTANLLLDGAPATQLGGASALTWVLLRAMVAVSAVQIGVAEGGLRLGAAYTSERIQFGRPLGSFQALQHQLADCWIDIDAMRVALWQAISDLDGDDPAAERSVRVAKWWSAQGGLDVVHRVQHVHGGMGVDVDYPVHRHFLWGKQLSGTLGAPGTVLADLGELLVAGETA